MESKNELNSFLEAKLALLKNYDLLTGEMQESVRKEDLDGLILLLSRREELARKIERVDSSLQKIMCSGEEKTQESAVSLRGMIDHFYRNSNKVLERIALKEKDLIPLMREESEELRKELIRTRGIRHAAATYYKPGPFSPRFVDASK
jgi:hypothetical protein